MANKMGYNSIMGTEEVRTATGRDLMLKAAFQDEIENIKAREKLGTFGFDANGARVLINYLKSRINEINEMKNANL